MSSTSLNVAGWIRLVIYVLSALVGIAAVIVTSLGYEEIAQLLGVIAGAGAAITGGTAVVNLPKAPDQHTGVDVGKLLPAITEIAHAARTYHEQQTTGRHAAAEPGSGLPIYHGATTAG